MRRPLTPAEAALWRRVCESARPLPGNVMPPAVEAPPAPKPVPRAHPTQRIAHPPVRAPASLADRGGEKRPRRGKLDIDAVFDLHGYTQDRARAALGAFVARQRDGGARVVLVISGKSGVLRQRLPDWLSAPDLRPLLAGFAQAHRRHGGEGAWYVFLKRAD
jgi:DNA-nicking Smr family endonuclease